MPTDILHQCDPHLRQPCSIKGYVIKDSHTIDLDTCCKYCEILSSVFTSVEPEHESNTFSSSLVMIRENDEKNDLISS